MALRQRPEPGARLAALRARFRRLRAVARLHKRALLALTLVTGIVLMVIHWS
jgi:hypothetical protein